eukprot:5281150-Amphidinium_carterae.1
MRQKRKATNTTFLSVSPRNREALALGRTGVQGSGTKSCDTFASAFPAMYHCDWRCAALHKRAHVVQTAHHYCFVSVCSLWGKPERHTPTTPLEH